MTEKCQSCKELRDILEDVLIRLGAMMQYVTADDAVKEDLTTVLEKARRILYKR